MKEFINRLSWYFTFDCWIYLFKTDKDSGDYTGRIRRAFCRFRGHPYGVVWYTTSGDEPEMICKNCGDYLG
jgi:hypothetical protein